MVGFEFDCWSPYWDSKKALNQTCATDVIMVRPYLALLRRSKSMLMSEVGSTRGFDGLKSTAASWSELEVCVRDRLVDEIDEAVGESGLLACGLLSCKGRVLSIGVDCPITGLNISGDMSSMIVFSSGLNV